MYRSQQRGGPPPRGNYNDTKSFHQRQRDPRGPPPDRDPRGLPANRDPRGPPPNRDPRGPPPNRDPRRPPDDRRDPRTGAHPNVDSRNPRNLGRAMEQATNLLSELNAARPPGRDPRRQPPGQRERNEGRFEDWDDRDRPPPPPPPTGRPGPPKMYDEQAFYYDESYFGVDDDDVYDSVYSQVPKNPYYANDRDSRPPRDNRDRRPPPGFERDQRPPSRPDWEGRPPSLERNRRPSPSERNRRLGPERDRRTDGDQRERERSSGSHDEWDRRPRNQMDYDSAPPPPPPPSSYSAMEKPKQVAPPPLPPPEESTADNKPPPPTPDVEHCQSRQPVLQTARCALYPPKDSDEKQAVKNKPPGCRTIFVGNLPALIDDDMLYEIFSGCGTVDSINTKISLIQKEARTMKYCYLKFKKRESADRGIHYNGHYLFVGNRGSPMLPHMISKIQVDYASDKFDYEEYESDPGPLAEGYLSFSESRASRIMSYLHEPEKFVDAAKVVVKWCKKGEMSRGNINTFFALITTAHSFLKKISARIDEVKEMIENHKEEEKNARQPLAGQCSAIKDVFAACRIRKVWDTFTKHQRKTLEQYEKTVEKEVEKINESLRLRHVPVHEVSDGEADMDLDSEPPVPGETMQQIKLISDEAAEQLNIAPGMEGDVSAVVATLKEENTKLQSQVAFLKAVAEQNSGLMVQLNKTQRDLEAHENEMRNAVFERDDQIVRLKLALQGLQQYVFYQPSDPRQGYNTYDSQQQVEPYEQRPHPFEPFNRPDQSNVKEEGEEAGNMLQEDFKVEVMDEEIEEVEMEIEENTIPKAPEETDKTSEESTAEPIPPGEIEEANKTTITKVKDAVSAAEGEREITEIDHEENNVEEVKEDHLEGKRQLESPGEGDLNKEVETKEVVEQEGGKEDQSDVVEKTEKEVNSEEGKVHKDEAKENIIIIDKDLCNDTFAAEEEAEEKVNTADAEPSKETPETKDSKVEAVVDEVTVEEEKTEDIEEEIKKTPTKRGRGSRGGRGRKRKTPVRRSRRTAGGAVDEQEDENEEEHGDERETKIAKLDVEGTEDERSEEIQTTDSQTAEAVQNKSPTDSQTTSGLEIANEKDAITDKDNGEVSNQDDTSNVDMDLQEEEKTKPAAKMDVKENEGEYKDVTQVADTQTGGSKEATTSKEAVNGKDDEQMSNKDNTCHVDMDLSASIDEVEEGKKDSPAQDETVKGKEIKGDKNVDEMVPSKDMTSANNMVLQQSSDEVKEVEPMGETDSKVPTEVMQQTDSEKDHRLSQPETQLDKVAAQIDSRQGRTDSMPDATVTQVYSQDRGASKASGKPTSHPSVPTLSLSKKQFSLVPVLALVLSTYPQGATLENLQAYCDSNQFIVNCDEIRNVLRKCPNLFMHSVDQAEERWWFIGFDCLK